MTTRELAKEVEFHRKEMVHSLDMVRRNEGSSELLVLMHAVECIDNLSKIVTQYIENEHNGKIHTE